MFGQTQQVFSWMHVSIVDLVVLSPGAFPQYLFSIQYSFSIHSVIIQYSFSIHSVFIRFSVFSKRPD